jgi:SPFH domain/Band 7 family protein
VDGAFAWIGNLISWFAQWVPRWVILDTTLAAVKYVKGQPVACEPGAIHWYWPVTTTMTPYPIARQTSNLKTQTMSTADDRPMTIAVGGMIVYEISDVLKIVAHTFDPDETIRDIAMSSIHDVLCLLTWDEIRAELRNGKLERALKAEAKKELERYGVRVLKVTLTDLAPCKVIKLVQSTSTD